MSYIAESAEQMCTGRRLRAGSVRADYGEPAGANLRSDRLTPNPTRQPCGLVGWKA